MKKYGGDFEFMDGFNTRVDKFTPLLAGFNYSFFDSGRGALLYLLNTLCKKKVLLPSYICHSIIQCFRNLNYQIEFYKINKDLTINFDDVEKKVSDCDLFFYINYFGKIQPLKYLLQIRNILKQNNIEIIEDTTHSFFSKRNVIGDYNIVSLRKWFDIPDGGCLYSKRNLHKNNASYNLPLLEVRKKAMHLKKQSKDNRGISDIEYLSLYKQGEDILDNQNAIHSISDYSFNRLIHHDFQKNINIRIENFNYLSQHINNKAITKFMFSYPEEVYLAYPIYIDNRDNFRQYLFNKNIFCPIHWPILEKKLKGFNDFNIEDHIISIMIDQRYSLDDMKYICDIINSY